MDRPRRPQPQSHAATMSMLPPSRQDQSLGRSERFILLLVSAVQFVNILDFMIVMPLGPDFARDLHIPVSRLGIVGGSYTGAAAVAGVLGSRFLDRFDRRSALAVSMCGLVLGTLSAGFAWNLPTLMLARVIAGAFGGPATSVALSVIADVVPAERRGRALGIVMGAFAAASVFGVPVSLELARLGGWRVPFFAVAGMGVIVAGGAIVMMPSLRLHMAMTDQRSRILTFLSEPTVIYSLGSTFSVMIASFCVVPNLSSYLQINRGFPREHLGALYLVGGSVSYVAMRIVGSQVDRLGATRVASFGTLLFVSVLAALFVYEVPWLPIMLLFCVLMTSMALRNVSLNTLSSRVPKPHERARFMSLQSAVQHIGAALGAMFSSSLLKELPDKHLQGMSTVAEFSIAMSLVLPLLLSRVERNLGLRRQPTPVPWTAKAEVARQSIPPA
jgi:predicted MFS family arabinose efflux permease